MSIVLRPYQQEIIADATAALWAGKSPLVFAPAGSGKSLMGAVLLRQFAKFALPGAGISLAHVKEIVCQNAKAYRDFYPGRSCSVYSTGLGEKDLSGEIVFAGVQSLVKTVSPNDSEEGEMGKLSPEIMLIDECHRISPDESSMYRTILDFWAGRRRHRLVGLSATPYRMDGKSLYGEDGSLFDAVIDGVSIARLQNEGYLAPLIGIGSRAGVRTDGVHSRRGDFVISELEEVATEPECVRRVCDAIVHHAEGRNKILVFAVTIAHAQTLAHELTRRGCRSDWVSGNLSMDRRDARIDAFRSGQIRALVNCAVLTTGFDCPAIDCIAMVRPTQSKGLFVQCIGRGLRIAEGKANCKLIDLGGNISRHTPIDGLPEEKTSDEQAMDREEKDIQERMAKERQVRFRLDYGDPMAGKANDEEVREIRVFDLSLRVEQNKKNPGLAQVRVTYKTDIGAILIWLLPEHSGGARWHSSRWFVRRGLEMPSSARSAAVVASGAAVPESISARRENGYWRVICEHFADDIWDGLREGRP
ncbi:MAG: DEAD/DEAH box helicase [Burkholderiales bacterium]